jgi:hypothetical protein
MKRKHKRLRQRAHVENLTLMITGMLFVQGISLLVYH